MDIFLIIFMIVGIALAFRSKCISYKIASVAIAVYAISLILWENKPDMGLTWLLIYTPFFAYMIFIKWQQLSKKYGEKK